MNTVALWARTSTDEQHPENQLQALRAWADARGWTITKVYEVTESAYAGKHHPMLAQAMEDARMGAFQTLACWSLDRISRQGIEDLLGTMRRFRERGCQVISLQESWTEGGPEMAELMTALCGFVARMESERRSERVRAGLARRKVEGKPIGRLPGARDRKPRKVSGYHARYGR
jgi:DNA invertase Pin-like site-specific DNA recombinase